MGPTFFVVLIGVPLVLYIVLVAMMWNGWFD